MPSVTVPIISMTTPSSFLDVEARLDRLFRHEEDLLDRQRDVLALQFAVKAGLARQRGVHAVGEDHHVRVDLAALAIAAHADAALAVHQQLFHRGLADQQRAGLAHLRREPLVELRADDRVAVVRRLVVVVAAVMRADEARVVEHPHALLDDVALQRRVVAEIGDHPFQRVSVEDRTLHVLAAGVFATLDLQHFQASLGQV
jgi:hypothetical protein